MQEYLIRHEQRGKYAYILKDGRARIMLETGRGDCNSVSICYYDKYGLNNIPGFKLNKVKMEYYGSGRFNDYYVVEVMPERRRLHYYFELHFKGGEVMNYDASGLNSIDKDIINEFSLFAIPYMNLEDAIDVPSWANDAIVYQIFPDSFYNPDGMNLAGLKDENGRRFLGGSLKGIKGKLPYLKDLGINTIYLTPIFKANTPHRYDTIDYMEIDERLGSKADFKALVDEIHKNKMRIILDGVFNHTSSSFFAFSDIVKNQKKSKYLDWYYIEGFPVINKKERAKSLNYDTFSFGYDMPKLRVSNNEVKEYIFSVLKYWTVEFNIDGWRLDVANEISLAFWREFRVFMKSLNKDILLIGESWNDSSIYLNGDTFDTVMNYLFRDYIFSLFKSTDALDIRINRFIALYTELTIKYPNPSFMALFNLISSHDVSRLYDELKDIRIIKAIVAMLFTMSGVPYIYYGDEVALKNDPIYYNRGAIDFNSLNLDMLGYYRRLIEIRRDNSALRNGRISFNNKNEGVLEYKKINNDNEIIVIINLSSVAYTPYIKDEILYKSSKDNTLNQYDLMIVRKK